MSPGRFAAAAHPPLLELALISHCSHPISCPESSFSPPERDQLGGFPSCRPQPSTSEQSPTPPKPFQYRQHPKISPLGTSDLEPEGT